MSRPSSAFLDQVVHSVQLSWTLNQPQSASVSRSGLCERFLPGSWVLLFHTSTGIAFQHCNSMSFFLTRLESNYHQSRGPLTRASSIYASPNNSIQPATPPVSQRNYLMRACCDSSCAGFHQGLYTPESHVICRAAGSSPTMP